MGLIGKLFPKKNGESENSPSDAEITTETTQTEAVAVNQEASVSAQDTKQEETPVEQEAPTEQPVEETPVEQEAPTEQPVEETSVEQEAPTEQPVEEAPVGQEAPTEQPVEEAPVGQEAPTEQPVEETPVGQEAPTEQPVEETPVGQEAPTEQPVEEAPVEQEAPTEQPVEETPVEQEAPTEQPVEETPVEQEAPTAEAVPLEMVIEPTETEKRSFKEKLSGLRNRMTACSERVEQKLSANAVGRFLLDVLDLLETVLASCFVVMLLFSFVFGYSIVEGDSMFPTLNSGERLLVSRLDRSYETGDILILNSKTAHIYDADGALQSADGLGKCIVKRLIATGGQTVNIDFATGIVYVDDKALDEPYTNTLTTRDEGAFLYPLTVPEGYVFVLGDNRSISKDSRHPDVGFVPESDVVGSVLLRLHPFTVL